MSTPDPQHPALAMAATLCVGDLFSSFDAFMVKVNDRRNSINEKLVIGKSCFHVAAANSKLKGAFKYKTELKYTNVTLRCVHEGVFFSRGASKQSTSLRNGCPVHIKLKANKPLNKLQIISLNLQHNHVMPERKDGVYAADRMLDADETTDVRKLLELGAPARKIQAFVSCSYDKQVKTKDLHNLRQKHESEKAGGKTVEDQVWGILETMINKDPGAQYSVFTEGGTVKIIFLQTSYMRKIFASYADVLYIDSTYCLNLYGYPVVVFMVVDGDNVGHCVGYACVRDERMVTLSVLYGEFVRISGVSVKTIVVDKDASEIGAVRQTMPNCNIVLCRFHVAKSLNDAVRKYCVKGEQDVMGRLARKMLCSGEEEFWAAFTEVPAGQLKTYLEKNWIPVRLTWANCFTKNVTTWGNKTNNFVERHNRALKTVGSAKTSLPAFFSSLLAYHKSVEVQMRRKVQDMHLRSKVFRPDFDTAKDILTAAYSILTPYACESIKKELNKLYKQRVVYDADSKTLAVSKNGQDVIYNIGESCQCVYFVEKDLPCWHVLAYHRFNNTDALANIPERYRKARLLDCMQEVEMSSGGVVSGEVTVIERGREKTEWQKLMIMKESVREMVAVGHRCGQHIFDKRLQVIKRINLWREGLDDDVNSCLENGDAYIDSDIRVFRDDGGVVFDDVRQEEMVDDVRQEEMFDDVRQEEMVDDVRHEEEMVDNVRRADMVEDVTQEELVDGVIQEEEMFDNVRRAELVDDVRQEEEMFDNVRRAELVDDVRQEEVGVRLDVDCLTRERREVEVVGSVGQGDECVHGAVFKSFGDIYAVSRNSKAPAGVTFIRSKTKGRPKGEGLTTGHFSRKRKRNNSSNAKKKRKVEHEVDSVDLEEEVGVVLHQEVDNVHQEELVGSMRQEHGEGGMVDGDTGFMEADSFVCPIKVNDSGCPARKKKRFGSWTKIIVVYVRRRNLKRIYAMMVFLWNGFAATSVSSGFICIVLVKQKSLPLLFVICVKMGKNVENG